MYQCVFSLPFFPDKETLVNLAGLLVSLALIPLVTDNPLWVTPSYVSQALNKVCARYLICVLSRRLTFILFFLFTLLHLFANYKAVRSVVMETLNEARLSIVLHRYLLTGQLLSPLEANQKEPVFLCMALKPNHLFLLIVHLRINMIRVNHYTSNQQYVLPLLQHLEGQFPSSWVWGLETLFKSLFICF